MKKIALVIEWWYPVYGWGQVHVDYLSKILAKDHGFTVDIFTRKITWSDAKKYDRDEITEDGVRIFRVWPLAIFFNGYVRLICLVTMTFYLWYKARSEKYDIIHAHAMLPGIPAKIVWRILWIPVIYTVHGTMFMDRGKKCFSYYIEKFITCWIRYDMEVSVSWKILHYKNRNNNIQIIYNGVDFGKTEAIKINQKYDKLTFLTVARMDWQKNHQIILDAILEIGAQFFRDQAIQFVRVGDGLEEERLSTIIENNSIWDIVLLKWKLDYEQTIKEYKKSHFFLLPSLSEWQPLTILEALACAMPVLATNVGDNAFFVRNDYNGELYKPWDLESLIWVIKKHAVDDKLQIDHMWNNWYKFIQQYSRERCVQRVVECYKSLS